MQKKKKRMVTVFAKELRSTALKLPNMSVFDQFLLCLVGTGITQWGGGGGGRRLSEHVNMLCIEFMKHKKHDMKKYCPKKLFLSTCSLFPYFVPADELDHVSDDDLPAAFFCLNFFQTIFQPNEGNS